jgi:hypothetical protein
MRGDHMSVLTTICWCAIAATTAWGLTLRRANAAIAEVRASSRREIRHWQDEAARARSRASQLEGELASWSEGCRQGRADVVSLMPALLAAQARDACLCQVAGSKTE